MSSEPDPSWRPAPWVRALTWGGPGLSVVALLMLTDDSVEVPTCALLAALGGVLAVVGRVAEDRQVDDRLRRVDAQVEVEQRR